MSSLFIDRKNIEVRSDAGALLFYEEGERIGTVPMAPLDRVIFKGSAVVNTKALGELGRHGVGVIMLSGWKHEPTLFFPAPHNDARRRVAQCVLSTDEEYRRLFAVGIIKEKVAEQARLIEEIAGSHPQAGIAFHRCRRHLHEDFERIDAQTSMEELRGIEGHAATAYFQALAAVLPASLNFKGRNRRPPTDPLNAVLSLTYTLFIAESALSIYKAGLDPFVGFLHVADFGRASFACDLVEVFRAGADRFAMGLFKDGTLRVEDFTMSGGSCQMGKAARSRYYPAYEAAADLWRRLMEKQAMKHAGDFVTEIAARERRSRSAGALDDTPF